MTVLIFIGVFVAWVALTLLFTHSSQRGRVDRDKIFVAGQFVFMSPERAATFERLAARKNSALPYLGLKVVTSKLLRPQTGWDNEDASLL